VPFRFSSHFPLNTIKAMRLVLVDDARAAEVAMAAFRVGFERWVADGNERGLADLIEDSLDELRAVTAQRTLIM
jgi:hypothetical protein